MKKSEAKEAIHDFFGIWSKDFTPAQLEHPSYYEFKSWAERNGYSRYFKFRSVMGADYDAELWFDQYFKQMWRR